MLSPAQLTVPARAEWGLVVHTVVLTYAARAGCDSSRIEDLGLLCGYLLDEAVGSPALEIRIDLSVDREALTIELEGSGGDSSSATEADGWSVPVAEAVMTHLARRSSVTREPGRLSIELQFPL